MLSFWKIKARSKSSVFSMHCGEMIASFSKTHSTIPNQLRPSSSILLGSSSIQNIIRTLNSLILTECNSLLNGSWLLRGNLSILASICWNCPKIQKYRLSLYRMVNNWLNPNLRIKIMWTLMQVLMTMSIEELRPIRISITSIQRTYQQSSLPSRNELTEVSTLTICHWFFRIWCFSKLRKELSQKIQ